MSNKTNKKNKESTLPPILGFVLGYYAMSSLSFPVENTAFEYFWLHKRTEKKKALFFTILITSFVLCTAVSIIMKVNY